MIIRGGPCLDIVDSCSGVGVKHHVVHAINCPGGPLGDTFYHVLWWSWVSKIITNINSWPLGDTFYHVLWWSWVSKIITNINSWPLGETFYHVLLWSWVSKIIIHINSWPLWYTLYNCVLVEFGLIIKIYDNIIQVSFRLANKDNKKIGMAQ